MIKNGLDLEQLDATAATQGALASLPNGRDQENNRALIEHSAVDIISEATVTNPNDGQPAVSYCEWALAAGKHVTTTNKGPVAFADKTLQALAKNHACQFQVEGTVMSGTPIIRFARETLKGCTLKGFEGILNGTANYVLGRVEQGDSFENAIKDAQAQGYAEANPAADLEGSDVKLKVVILANTLLQQSLSPLDVRCEGIAGLTETQVREAPAAGQHWKLIGQAKVQENGAVKVSIGPVLLSSEHPLSGVNGATNALVFNTDLLGDVLVSGPGAGRIETGYALLSDIIAIAESEQLKHKMGQSCLDKATDAEVC